jgi:glycerophosphoryl diester phosphodiesterase
MEAGSKQTIIIGHRGAAGEAPENTLGSFKLAVEQGAEAVELDIHESADGELIVCHDSTVDRTTDGQGEIRLLTVRELKELDAGSWFDPRFSAERLPALEEVFALVPADIIINVEVKCPYSPRLEVRLLELLAQYKRLQSVIVSSFDHKILVKLKLAQPALNIGLLYAANFQNHRLMADSAGVEVYSLHPNYHLLDDEDIAEAVQHGLQVYPYTMNAEADWAKFMAVNVSGIITDFPGRLKAFREANYR